jgi:hypothetical protein
MVTSTQSVRNEGSTDTVMSTCTHCMCTAGIKLVHTRLPGVIVCTRTPAVDAFLEPQFMKETRQRTQAFIKN